MPNGAANAVRLIRLGRTDAWKTQALYHAVAERMTDESPDTIILCRPTSPYVCLGYHQSLDAVLDRDACTELRLPILRRQIGGGATYLDQDQLFYQCVLHASRLPVHFAAIFARLLSAPVAALRRLGLDAELRETNEIQVGGKRIAGTGGGRIGQAGVVVGNLLVDFDFDVMARLWRAPFESFRALGRAAMLESMTTLRQCRVQVQFRALEQILIEEYERALDRPLVLGRPTAAEWTHARELARQLPSSEYLGLHEHAPPRPLKIAAGVYIHAVEFEWEGIPVRAGFCVREGIIQQARFESAPAREWNHMEVRLVGAPFAEWEKHMGGQ